MTKQRKDIHAIIDKMQAQETDIIYMQSQERRRKTNQVRMINEQIAREQKEKDKQEEMESIQRSEALYAKVMECLSGNPDLQAVMEYLDDTHCTIYLFHKYPHEH